MRRRLIGQLLIVAAILSAILYVSVRAVARDAVTTSRDGVLGAAAVEMIDQLRGTEDGVEIDIPYSAFSMLGAISDDRIFYRIVVRGSTITGYEDLPLPESQLRAMTPEYYTRIFRGSDVRIAAIGRSILVEGRPIEVMVLVAQTMQGQSAVAANLANRAAIMGLGFFAVAALLSLITARNVLQPVTRVAEAMRLRGPGDLRPVSRRVPSEIAPLVSSLNGFIARLRRALSTTETFIAEAAHRVRTPLTTVRTQADIALRQSEDPELRETLRQIIRASDDCARSAGQLLDHATVAFRTDQRATERMDLGDTLRAVVGAYRPSATMKDIALDVHQPGYPVHIEGDALLIESALGNLVDNAIKYTPAEGTIDVTLTQDSATAVLEVRDTGRGLDDAALEILTERFRRGTNVADVVGSGLGLTIVAQVAELHGGALELAAGEGGGACARLSFPLS